MDDGDDVVTGDERESKKSKRALRYNAGLTQAVDELLGIVREHGLRALPPGTSEILGKRAVTPVSIVEIAVRLVVRDARLRVARAEEYRRASETQIVEEES